MKSSAVVAVVLGSALLSGCRTAGSGDTFELSPAATLAERAIQLRTLASQRPELASYSRIRVTGPTLDRSFTARLTLTANRGRIDVLTPLGTEAAALEVTGESMLLVDHTTNSFWRGPVVAATSVEGLTALPITELTLAFPLLFGLPIGGDFVCDEAGRCSGDAATYTLTSAGLSSASVGPIAVVFAVPAVPATDVIVRSGATTVRVINLDVVRSGPLEPLMIPRGYKEMERQTP